MRRDDALRMLRDLKPRFSEMNIRRMAIFGSVARDEAAAGSDLDILIDVQTRPFTLLDMARTQRELQEYMGVPVDLLTFNSMRQGKHDHILNEVVDV